MPTPEQFKPQGPPGIGQGVQMPIGGLFAIPLDEFLAALNGHLALEYKAWTLYKHMAGIVTGPYAKIQQSEFNDHAGEEEEHISLLYRKIVALGGTPSTPDIAPMPLPATIEEALLLTYQDELVALESLNKLIKLCGDNEAMAKELQDMAAKEAEHAEELKIMALPMPALFPRATTAATARRTMTKASASKALREAVVAGDEEQVELLEDILDSLTLDVPEREGTQDPFGEVTAKPIASLKEKAAAWKVLLPLIEGFVVRDGFKPEEVLDCLLDLKAPFVDEALAPLSEAEILRIAQQYANGQGKKVAAELIKAEDFDDTPIVEIVNDSSDIAKDPVLGPALDMVAEALEQRGDKVLAAVTDTLNSQLAKE